MPAMIHNGWLKTRNGDYFSPRILSNNVYDAEGNVYDVSDISKAMYYEIEGSKQIEIKE